MENVNRQPLDMETGERLLAAEEMSIVPDNRSPIPGQFWLTTARVVARWTEGGGLLRAATTREIVIWLADVADTRTPGGPLVQVIAKNGARLSLQSFRPLALRQQIAEAVAAADSALLPAPPPDADALMPHGDDTEDSADLSTSDAAPAISATASASIILCPRCDSKTPVEGRFCPHCGMFLRSRSSYCRRCDHDYPAHYRYCAHCGETLITAAPPPSRR
jgi:hypothetical protein